MSQENLTGTYNEDTRDPELFQNDPRGTLMSHVRKGKVPAILASDTSATQDILGFISKAPDNLWYAFYNPSRVNVDDIGRLTEKTFRRFYKPTLSIIRWTAWFNPKLREDGIKNLKALDLDSFSYLEPILHDSDTITLKHLQPLFLGNESYANRQDFNAQANTNNDESSNGSNGNSVAYNLTQTAESLKDFAKKIQTGNINAAHQDEYNEILGQLYDHQEQTRRHLEKITNDIDIALSKIDGIKIRSGSLKLKQARLKALRDHLMRLQKQGIDMHKHIENTRKNLHDLGNGNGIKSDQFAQKIYQIGRDLQLQTKKVQANSQDLIHMAHARVHRKLPVKNEQGLITDLRPAAFEEYRRLKLGIDLLFVPDTPQTLGVTIPKDKAHNAESYFCKIVENGMNGVFDKDGNYIQLSNRGPKFGEDLAEFIVKLYALNKAEDALYAIRLLKMAEGKENYQMFPSGFKDFLTTHMCAYYGIDKHAVESNPHAKSFINRAHEICASDEHSPLLYGPRDTAKKYVKRVRKYIYGRMYPGSDRFIAVPLHMDFIEAPLILARSNIWAYMTGGAVTDFGEGSRAPKENRVLEDQLKKYIKYNWWWDAENPENAPKNEDGTPKKKNLYKRMRNFYKRSPFWLKTTMRIAQMASLAGAFFIITGGASLPIHLLSTLYATAGISAINYASKTARNIWRLPFVNRPAKFTAKWATISALATGSIKLSAPFMPAIASWAGTLIAANPATAMAIASPFIALIAIKLGVSLYKRMKNGPKPSDKPMTFGAFRKLHGINDDPLKLKNERGEFSLSTDIPKPDNDAKVILDLEPVAKPNMKLSDDFDFKAAEENTASKLQKQNDDDQRLETMMDLFAEKLAKHDEEFMNRFEEILKDDYDIKKKKNKGPDNDDIIDAEIIDVP